jgi:transketolase
MTSPISMTRLEMETAWLSKVKAAQQRYCEAAAQYNELRKKSAPHVAHAVWKAALEKSGTRREYLDVLNTFSRLVVDGEVPPAEE